jgi:hypothetical protein
MNKVAALLVIVFIGVLSTVALAGNTYGGVFRTGTEDQKLLIGETVNSFISHWSLLSAQNFRLKDLEVYKDSNDGSVRVNGVFRPGTFGHYFFIGFSFSQMMSKYSELTQQGYRLVNVETYVESGVRKYAVVFHEGSDAHFMFVGDYSSFTSKFAELSSAGLRLADVEPYLDIDGIIKYIAVFRSGNDAHFLYVADPNTFFQKNGELTAAGLELTVFKSVKDALGRQFYVGVFRTLNGSQYLLPGGQDLGTFVTKYKQLAASNFRLENIITY